MSLASRPSWTPPPVLAAAVLLPLALGACRGTRVPACPLEPAAVLADVRRERASVPEAAAPTAPDAADAAGASGADAWSLARAADRHARMNPDVRAARAAWRTAQAQADVPTPLANPTIGAGPLLLGGPEIVRIAQVGFELGLGWAVPLAPKRALQDDLNDVVALAAFTDAAALERTSYLALRREQVDAVLAGTLRAAHRELEDTARDAAALMRRSVTAGEVSEIDASLLALEAEEFETQGLALARDHEDALAAWRDRLGLSDAVAGAPDPADLPALPEAPPAPEVLERIVLRDHPELARLRAAYLVAEKRLRVEAARAVPDLELGATYEDEVELEKLGLPLGIEIPIFDRNQGGIAEALARRDEIRERYAAALTQALAAVERARARIDYERRIVARYDRQHAMGVEMSEQARRAVEVAGGVDLPRYLEILRTTRRIRVEEIRARSDLYAAWLDLEHAAGAPLLRFRHEGGLGGEVLREIWK